MAHWQPYTIKTVNLPRGQREVIRFTDRKALQSQIKEAVSFSRQHGGQLPDTQFWRDAGRVFKEDPQLFARFHQCNPLLWLLRHDPGTPPVPCDGIPVVCVPPPDNQVHPVPEPSTKFQVGQVLIMAAAFAFVITAVRKRWI